MWSESTGGSGSARRGEVPVGSCAGAVLGTSGIQQAPCGDGHSTGCLSWHPCSGQPLSAGARLCRPGQTVCVSAHALLVPPAFPCSRSHLPGWWESQ